MTSSPLLLVMGVSGAGKTTIAQALAARLGWRFLDADDLHPPANHAKMARGEPLDDDDRRPWLEAVAAWMAARRAEGEPAVVACSALKRAYRAKLRDGAGAMQIIFIQASADLLEERLKRRTGHFMPPSLLASQFAALEPPTPEEGAIIVDAHASPEKITEAVMEDLRRRDLACVKRPSC